MLIWIKVTIFITKCSRKMWIFVRFMIVVNWGNTLHWSHAGSNRVWQLWRGRGSHTIIFLITKQFVYFLALLQIIVKNVVPQ